MRLLLPLASFALLSSLQIFAQLQPRQESTPRLSPSPHRFAILIGVANYDSENGIESLTGPVKDVEQMRDALIKSANFDPANIVMLTSKTRHPPTQRGIEVALSNMQPRIQQDDLLLIMFSGHGMENSGEVMLLAQDSINNGDATLLKQTSVPLSAVTDFVQHTRAAQTIVLLDACRSNPSSNMSKGEAVSTMTPAYKKAFDFEAANQGIKAFVVLYATSEGQFAWTDQKRQMGYFSAALVDGLNGKAAGTEGDVTLASLFRYLKKEVPRAARDSPEPKTQIPDSFSKGDANDLVLAHFDVPRALTPSTSQIREEDKPNETGDKIVELCKPTVSASHEKRDGNTIPEVCPAVRLDLLDTSYHQEAFTCCGGIAKKTMTLSDIPAGFELSISASGSYSVSETKLLGDKFSLVLFCAPSSSIWSSGCKNTVTVKAHYLSHPKIAQIPPLQPSRPISPFVPQKPAESVPAQLADQIETLAKEISRIRTSETMERNGSLGHGGPGACNSFGADYNGNNISKQCQDAAISLNAIEVSRYISYRPQIRQLREKSLSQLQLSGLELLNDSTQFEAADKEAGQTYPIPKTRDEAYNPPLKFLKVAAYLSGLAERLKKLR
jgi:Caspase domain